MDKGKKLSLKLNPGEMHLVPSTEADRKKMVKAIKLAGHDVVSEKCDDGCICAKIPKAARGALTAALDKVCKFEHCGGAKKESLDYFANLLQNVDSVPFLAVSDDMIEEALEMARVHVGKITPHDIPALKDDVFMIKNESPVIDALVKMLALPADSKPRRMLTGFVCYDEDAKSLFFSYNQSDLPSLMRAREAGRRKS
jgi:hypothetical protein